MKKQPKTKAQAITTIYDIKLEPPVKIYTAKELAVMPLSKMLKCRDEQEEYYKRTFLTLRSDLIEIKDRMEGGEVIQMYCVQKRTKTATHFEFGGGKTKQACSKSACLPQAYQNS